MGVPTSNSVGVMPPLPEPLTTSPQLPSPQDLPGPILVPQPQFPPLQIRSVRCGCYLINYKPNQGFLVSYDGTLRVECHSQGRTASGDLYQRPLSIFPPPAHLLPPPNPAAGIPILARHRYRYYLRVTQIVEFFTIGNSFTLGFEMYRFTAPNTWTLEPGGPFTAVMTWTPAPVGYPSSTDYMVGDVKNGAGTIVGRLTMGWVSKYLRKATVEIDRVSVSEAPLNNGASEDWKSVFDAINWELNLDVSNANVIEPSGVSWSNAEMHQAMLARRDASNLDTEWRYHILAVRNIDVTPRGIMYDNGATDSNNVPREGVGISSHWVIPNTSDWGLVRNMRFGTAAAPYFRTAVHEAGHALGLFHNTVDLGFMNTTDVIAAAGTAGTPFPLNIRWAFATDDQKRLRHYPDPFVRPGGTAFGTASMATPPITPTDTDAIIEVEELKLNVSPLLAAVPLGAPVRVNLKLVNSASGPLLAPPSLSMKAGSVRGTVTDPSGTQRTFSPLVLCVEDQALQTLEPGKSITNSLTLLRGGQGALFPAAGVYRIRVEVRWEVDGVEYRVTGETNVIVTATVDEAHARAALKVISTPDTLLALVIGGDHLTDGIEAIQAALDNPVLRPHFAYVEAKRLAERFGKRKANLKAAAALITDETVMSPAEAKKASKLIKGEDS